MDADTDSYELDLWDKNPADMDEFELKEYYDLVPGDDLTWQCVSVVDKETALLEDQARAFYEQWTEPAGPEDDDIGDQFVTTDARLAHANRDIDRVVAQLHTVFADHPQPPDPVSARKTLLMDRARRIALGDMTPAPLSLAMGVDGGVWRRDTALRRPRPEDDEDVDAYMARLAERDRKGFGRRFDMLPRHRADSGTRCAGLGDDDFGFGGLAGGLVAGNARVGAYKWGKKGKKGKKGSAAFPFKRYNTASRLERLLAAHLLRQPKETALRATLRHLHL